MFAPLKPFLLLLLAKLAAGLFLLKLHGYVLETSINFYFSDISDA
jgi:hypothetical protein